MSGTFFDNFLNWVISQEWKGLSLDKDLLIEDNQTYSPSACVFIDHSLNKFLTLRGGLRGEYPVGVNYKNSHESFVSQIMEGGKKKHLGLYVTPMLAHKAWQVAKRDQAIYLQSQQTDSRVIAGLQRIIDKLNNHIENNIETKDL